MISKGISCLSFPISVIEIFHNIVHNISAYWPLRISFNIHACNSCLFSLCYHGRTQRLKGDHIKEMLITTTYSFAWVWNVRPWGEAHFCWSMCAGGKTCFILEVVLYFWFFLQSSELRLFTFDFHFKDFFVTGMVIKLITLLILIFTAIF